MWECFTVHDDSFVDEKGNPPGVALCYAGLAPGDPETGTDWCLDTL